MNNKQRDTQSLSRKGSRFKFLYWVLGIFLALMIFMAGLHFWNEGSSTAGNTTGGSNSSSSSGTGGNTHNPAQEIQKHLKQMGI